MPIEQLTNHLEISMAQVLESMCFILPGEPAEEHTFANEPWVERTLTFHGHEEGQFGVRAPHSVAIRIASDFLCEDPIDLTEKQVGEVMGELANMVCGNLLGHCYQDRTFALTTPVAQDPASTDQDARMDWEEGILVAWVKTI